MKPLYPIACAFLLVIAAAGCSTAKADAKDTTQVSTPGITELRRPAYRACMAKAGGRVEQAPCIAQEQAFQLGQMQRAYEALATTLDTAQKAALAQSQSAWRALQMADSQFGVALLDPLGMDLSVSDNDILLTIQRRQMLEHLLKLKN
jgi:uncharacterized protein YecT (DUF1311 family)